MLESRSLYSNFWCGMTPQVLLNSTLHPSTNPDLLSSLSFFFNSVLPVRVTTSEPQTTSQSGSGSGSAAFPFPWCTAPSYWTCVVNSAGTWLSTPLTQTTAGHLMTSWCLPSRHVKQVSLNLPARSRPQKERNASWRLHRVELGAICDFIHAPAVFWKLFYCADIYCCITQSVSLVSCTCVKLR